MPRLPDDRPAAGPDLPPRPRPLRRHHSRLPGLRPAHGRVRPPALLGGTRAAAQDAARPDPARDGAGSSPAGQDTTRPRARHGQQAAGEPVTIPAAAGPGQAARPAFDASTPNTARIYDYLLGGKTTTPPTGTRPASSWPATRRWPPWPGRTGRSWTASGVRRGMRPGRAPARRPGHLPRPCALVLLAPSPATGTASSGTCL